MFEFAKEVKGERKKEKKKLCTKYLSKLWFAALLAGPTQLWKTDQIFRERASLGLSPAAGSVFGRLIHPWSLHRVWDRCFSLFAVLLFGLQGQTGCFGRFPSSAPLTDFALIP